MIFTLFCVFIHLAVGEEDASVSKLVEMTEERTSTLVPMETSQQQMLQDQQNGPVGVATIGGVGEVSMRQEGAGYHEDDNSSEDDS